VREPEDELLTGWGLTSPSRATVHHPETPGDVAAVLTDAPRRGAVARGLGRAYGDAAQNGGGAVIDMTAQTRIRSLDLEAGTVSVDAGASLDQLMRALVPLGWFVPVTPGTRYVTVGGAIAADIHGKNHHVEGSISNHLESITLRLANGEERFVRRDGPGDDGDVLAATAGGMGLTGVVTSATMRLLPIETSLMSVDTDRIPDLDTLLAAMEAGDDDYRYSVAWIDLVARGANLGRSVLTRGDHASREQLAAAGGRRTAEPLAFNPRPLLVAPPWVPSGLLRRETVAAFNEVWFRRAPKHAVAHLESIARFFHPLDGVIGWNRIYGRHGFLQYQFVVPFGAEGALRAIVERLAEEQCPSFLAVLKRFGAGNPLLSFPAPGWTLALDIPAALRGLGSLLDALDEVVLAAGGRLYLAKDSRMRAEHVPLMYPDLDRWREIRGKLDPNGTLQSDLARRLDLLG
jgi:decaprenylphospho-beta-D-ribofuranose 2-oxidase